MRRRQIVGGLVIITLGSSSFLILSDDNEDNPVDGYGADGYGEDSFGG